MDSHSPPHRNRNVTFAYLISCQRFDVWRTSCIIAKKTSWGQIPYENVLMYHAVNFYKRTTQNYFFFFENLMFDFREKIIIKI